MNIHLEWNGPYTLDEVAAFGDEATDYGLYAAVGRHPVYGHEALLYIGIASQQVFSSRTAQHRWDENDNSSSFRFYVARLISRTALAEADWTRRLELAEKLLIFSHSPSWNSSNVANINEQDVAGVHVYNWKDHGPLLPEVSEGRYTSRFDHIDYGRYCSTRPT
jgi:hypothetical protein